MTNDGQGRLGRVLVLAAAMLLGTAGVARAELVDRLVAVVNGDIITLSEVEKRAAAELSQLPLERDAKKRGELRQKVLSGALEMLIGEKLLEAEARELGVEVAESEVQLALDDVQKQNNLEQAQFEDMLRREGFTLSEYKRFMRNHLTRMKLVNAKVRTKVKVSDADLKSEYARYANAEGGDVEVHARHILVEVPQDAAKADVEKARQRALVLAERARAPGVDFAELAKRESSGSSAEDGGDLGFFGRGVMMPDFERAAFALKDGEVSPPVRSATGWHVIKVMERRTVAAKDFDEVKEELRNRIAMGQMAKFSEQYVQELRQKATVEVML
jgi:peptidyl-prolyl cis-trans isomerase SurA